MAGLRDTYHYVYLLKIENDIDERKYYIGCRSSKCYPLEDVSYMSSSKAVKQFLSENKEVQFHKKILIICEDRETALKYEIALHNHYDVAKNPEFFNLAKQTSTRFDITGNEFVGAKISKSLEGKPSPLKGKKLSKSHCIAIGNASRGRICSKETRDKISKNLIGRNTWTKGRKLTEEHKQKICIASTGRLQSDKSKAIMSKAKSEQSKVKCEHCSLVLTRQNYAKYHGDNCIGTMYYSNIDGSKMRVKLHLGETPPDGWTTTKASYGDYMWVNNGTVNKKIKRDAKIMSGFVPGRCKSPEGVFA